MGSIDLLIGTHRLLSSDVKFKDLGLLVIDEEQRFGVKHKEKIKQLKVECRCADSFGNADPRTLHMSLSGIKDMSTIEEPPEDRYPVQTYVMEMDDFVIREAIEKELARGGQVYVLYNRVDSINRVASEIESWFRRHRWLWDMARCGSTSWKISSWTFPMGRQCAGFYHDHRVRHGYP